MKCPNCGYEGTKKLYLEGFDIFWKVYPRKIGKGLAEKVWSKLKPNFELFSRIIEAVESHKTTDQWKVSGGIYVPHPSTWLNQRRWEDEAQKKDQSSPFDPQKLEDRKAKLEKLREQEWARLHGTP